MPLDLSSLKKAIASHEKSELGYSDAILFLSLQKEQKMESLERHRNWQNTLYKD